MDTMDTIATKDCLVRDAPRTLRVEWIDQARGLAVLFIVLGHLPIHPTLRWGLYAFHVPLFFLLSGMLWKAKPWRAYTLQKARTRLVPYLVLSVLTYAWWMQAPTVDPWKPLVGILYGVGITPWMDHNPPLWFFPCLFVMEMCFLAVHRWTHGHQAARFSAIAIGAVLGYASLKLSGLRWPWGAELALIALPFFALGVWLTTDWTIPRWWPALVPVFLLSAWCNGPVDLNYGSIHLPPLYYLAATSGTMTMLCAIRQWHAPGGAWVGRHTVPIVGTHAPLSWLFLR